MSGGSAKTEHVQVGGEMPDGTILAGYYKGKPLYATPKDAPGTYTFSEAAKYAKNLDAHGHRDWRVPTKAELNILFDNREAIGGFNLTDSDHAGWYWSASQTSRGTAWGHRFSDGNRKNYNKGGIFLAVRCVR